MSLTFKPEPEFSRRLNRCMIRNLGPSHPADFMAPIISRSLSGKRVPDLWVTLSVEEAMTDYGNKVPYMRPHMAIGDWAEKITRCIKTDCRES